MMMDTNRFILAPVLFFLLLASGCISRQPDVIDEEWISDEEITATTKPSLSMSATRVRANQLPPPAAAGNTAPETPAESAAEVEVTSPYSYRLQSGDPVVIHLRGIYPRDEEVEDIVDDLGNITLPHLGDLPAAGRSTSQLEAEIRRLYIEGKFYNSITINVVMPQRTYFIRGEVKGPGRFPVAGGMTLLQAIATAGGYTEFANPKKVNLIRAGRTQTYNMRSIERRPELDVRLESGDVIVVERSIF